MPFYFTHEETFKIACDIYNKLYKKKPTNIHYFHDEEKTWNAFIVSNDLTNEEYVFNLFDEPTIKIHENSYYPLIGALNGYGMDENPAFFMMISSPFDTSKTSFLSLDSFRFLKEEDKSYYYKSKGVIVEEKMQQFVERRALQFKNEENNFKILLKDYQKITLDREYFMPIILDLYNQNRNVESVKNDSKLLKSISDLRNAAEAHLRPFDKNVNWATFISFIVRYNSFDLKSGIFPKHEIESLFSKKKAYTKFIEMFGKFKVDKKSFNSYANNQVSDWEKVKKVIIAAK